MRITRIGMMFNISLAVLKLITGYQVGSLGLVADGYNSTFDIVTDLAVIIGTTLGVRPADRNHPFGHGKLETFSTVIVDMALLGLGVGIIWTAIVSLGKPPEPIIGGWVMGVAAITFIVKDRLYRATKIVATQCRSSALDANAWNHRTDSFLAVIVLGGGIAAIMDWPQGDKIAGLIVGIFITVVGAKLIYEALFELAEGSPDDDTVQKVSALIEGFEEVKGWHKLRVRRVGRELQMDIHILLDKDLTLQRGHEIVEKIEDTVQSGIEWPTNLTIHIDPTTDDILKARRDAGDETLKL